MGCSSIHKVHWFSSLLTNQRTNKPIQLGAVNSVAEYGDLPSGVLFALYLD